MEETKPPGVPKKPNKVISVILAVLGLVIVILLIGGGAALAGHAWNPKWNPFKPTSNSDKIIRAKILQEIHPVK